jgi:hypothetical protein
VHWFFTHAIVAQLLPIGHCMQILGSTQALEGPQVTAAGHTLGIDVHSPTMVQYLTIIVSAHVVSPGAQSVHVSPQTLPAHGL